MKGRRRKRKGRCKVYVELWWLVRHRLGQDLMTKAVSNRESMSQCLSLSPKYWQYIRPKARPPFYAEEHQLSQLEKKELVRLRDNGPNGRRSRGIPMLILTSVDRCKYSTPAPVQRIGVTISVTPGVWKFKVRSRMLAMAECR